MKFSTGTFVFLACISVQNVMAESACRLKADILQGAPGIGRLVSWYPLSDAPQDSMFFAKENEEPLMRLDSRDSTLRQSLSALKWHREEDIDGNSGVFVSAELVSGVSFRQSFFIDYAAGAVSCTVMICGDSAFSFLASHGIGMTIMDSRIFEKRGAGGCTGNSGTVEFAAITR
jgi:hypothetical protein